MAIRRRIKRLEVAVPVPGPVRTGPSTLQEIRALERHIALLEAEMDPDEVSKARAAALEGLEPLEEIAAVQREIEKLKAWDTEGGG